MNQPSATTTPKKIYGEAGLIYIRYNAEIEVKENGQKKIKGTRPPFSKIQKQIEYKAGAGKFYSLLMGREIKPGRFVILLDFDNKVEGESRSGLDLAKKLKMDNYNAPKQTTPSKGLHYLFYVDREQAEHIKSRTGLTYDGVNYNADVKFKNSLCNCAPSKIEGYGDYKWVNPSKLKNIPKLPEEIYNIIKTKATRKTTSTAARGTTTAGGGEAPKATRKQRGHRDPVLLPDRRANGQLCHVAARGHDHEAAGRPPVPVGGGEQEEQEVAGRGPAGVGQVPRLQLQPGEPGGAGEERRHRRVRAPQADPARHQGRVRRRLRASVHGDQHALPHDQVPRRRRLQPRPMEI